jgi:hypothetical protein
VIVMAGKSSTDTRMCELCLYIDCSVSCSADCVGGLQTGTELLIIIVCIVGRIATSAPSTLVTAIPLCASCHLQSITPILSDHWYYPSSFYLSLVLAL